MPMYAHIVYAYACLFDCGNVTHSFVHAHMYMDVYVCACVCTCFLVDEMIFSFVQKIKIDREGEIQ